MSGKPTAQTYGHATPSPDLVKRVKDLYHKRVSDVRFLIPVLTGLEKQEIITVLPKLIKQSPSVVKEVFNRLLGCFHSEGKVSGTSPLSPSELLVALHMIEPSKKANTSESKGDIRSVMKAIRFCFDEKTIYTQEVLAIVLQQLMEINPLPTLFMRTMTKPQSFSVLLQLPPRQLESAFEVCPELRDNVVTHVQSFTPHQRAHIPRSVLQILDKEKKIETEHPDKEQVDPKQEPEPKIDDPASSPKRSRSITKESRKDRKRSRRSRSSKSSSSSKSSFSSRATEDITASFGGVKLKKTNTAAKDTPASPYGGVQLKKTKTTTDDSTTNFGGVQLKKFKTTTTDNSTTNFGGVQLKKSKTTTDNSTTNIGVSELKKTIKTTTKTSKIGSTTTVADQRILKSTRINIDQEKIPDFAVARPRILPVLKPPSWERSTKDMLKKIDPKKPPDVLYFPVKTLPGSSLGYTLAIVNEEGSMHYILRSYLDAWNIPEKVLKDVAIRNLEHRLENRDTKLWKRSKTGVYYLDNLGSVSASVLLLPQFLDGLDFEEGDPIIVAPSGDICLVGGAKSDTQLCIMGEIALRYSKDPQRFDIKPLRFAKHRFHEYVPKTYASEQNVPQTLDEVRTIRLRLKPLKISRQNIQYYTGT
ncbi:hypothetical protein QZH41_004195 [Actinostola sp. cb2023]|nr:hypothetical protein QZH41_004195 [Actinostola sp. cb2023]